MNKVEHYERLLSTKEKNAFILPKGYLVIRDITDTGHLVKYVSEAEFKKKGRKQLWVLLKLKVFRNKRGEFYPLFMCNSCEKMGSTDLLALNNEESDVVKYKCLHSRVSDNIVKKKGDWKNLWNLRFENILPTDEIFDPTFEPLESQYQTLREDNLFLVACFKNDEVTLMSTLTMKSKTPDCTKCSVRGCRCYKEYKAAMLAKHKEDFPDENSYPDFFCNRINRTRYEARQNFLNQNQALNFQVHNKEPVLYPIFRDKEMLNIFKLSQQDNTEFPEHFIPEYKNELRCVHGHMYQESNKKLVILSDTITIFAENYETVKQITNYARPTVGGCRCQQQIDTTKYCLWNMGASKFIKMDYLLQVVHKFSNLSAIESAFKARSDQFSALGCKTELSSKEACYSVIGFCKQLKFQDEDWMCDNCGETPSMLGRFDFLLLLPFKFASHGKFLEPNRNAWDLLILFHVFLNCLCLGVFNWRVKSFAFSKYKYFHHVFLAKVGLVFFNKFKGFIHIFKYFPTSPKKLYIRSKLFVHPSCRKILTLDPVLLMFKLFFVFLHLLHRAVSR